LLSSEDNTSQVISAKTSDLISIAETRWKRFPVLDVMNDACLTRCHFTQARKTRQSDELEIDQTELSTQEAFSGHVDRVFLYSHSQTVSRSFGLLDFAASESECTREICGFFGGLATNLETSDYTSGNQHEFPLSLPVRYMPVESPWPILFQ